MSDFLEKLKKGMNIKETPEIDNLDDIDNSDNQPSEVNFASLEEKQVPATTQKTKAEIPSIEEFSKEKKPDVSTANKKTSKKILSKNASEKQKEKSTKKKKTRTKKSSAGSNLKKIKIKKEASDFKVSSPAQVLQNETWTDEKQIGQLVIDLYETGKEIVIQSAIAGVKPENLDILIENDMVKIRGYREKTSEEKDRNYFYQECHWGPFSREIILPVEVNPGQAQAIMKNGILTIRIPKIEKVVRKKLIIKEG